MLSIDSKKETAKITEFLQTTLQKQQKQRVILALSGGIDSTTSLFLLKQALPAKNVSVLHLPYFSEHEYIKTILQTAQIPQENVHTISIKPFVDPYKEQLKLDGKNQMDQVRLGNIMARTRMILLYDFAKKTDSLVVGTENRSEYYLAYFTRFGDEASDIEPIRHLYKTQVYQLAKYLGVPKEVIEQSPTAGLWHEQTDEKEFGFTYAEADEVLTRYFDQKLSIEEIKKLGFPNTEKIMEWVRRNDYKHHVPYTLNNTNTPKYS